MEVKSANVKVPDKWSGYEGREIFCDLGFDEKNESTCDCSVFLFFWGNDGPFNLPFDTESLRLDAFFLRFSISFCCSAISSFSFSMSLIKTSTLRFNSFGVLLLSHQLKRNCHAFRTSSLISSHLP
ncbi:unnamed protein product [Chondrus crispus]|uniref:Uncharacterized protein n=1 Tax=Chondrus crispus TaxID=2769 RepID=R7QD99_CHOCR|nr:unnamed protein product [Chondrus crispus]CDF36034.1 unnamed protein product [Chondrus crispus]|eukprot:XP_005715853.1 unnamed protein product [Chondrus crispus]